MIESVCNIITCCSGDISKRFSKYARYHRNRFSMYDKSTYICMRICQEILCKTVWIYTTTLLPRCRVWAWAVFALVWRVESIAAGKYSNRIKLRARNTRTHNIIYIYIEFSVYNYFAPN